MNWSNVRLILAREIRDQLRDRRTLFMIAVLPILLYPLLGMSFLQIGQFMQEQPTSVLVVGAENLVEAPRLIENNHFATELFAKADEIALLELDFASSEPAAPGQPPPDPVATAREAVLSRRYDAALYIPRDFAERLDAVREASRSSFRRARDDSPEGRAEPVAMPLIPKPEIVYTTANEQSDLAFRRLQGVLQRWADEVGRQNLVAAGVSPIAARPFELETADLADQTGGRRAAVWARILPVMLLLWALTGAFYPAVDLCAGEKERGTLETLLSSPAERTEIVVGKLVTIMLFSIGTAILNLASIAATGWLVLARMPQMGTPPWTSLLWLLLALVPVSALFSALCLALAALARSTKEGQYYLMPLLLVTMPLAILPIAPGVKLTLGNSLIPVTNVVLLLRSTLEGNYQEALRFVLPVVGVTLVCCLLAIRWAVDQFNQESVLFREGERLDPGLWLRRLVRERKPTPGVAAAVSCGLAILVVKFFVELGLAGTPSFASLARGTLILQLGVVAPLALLMTLFLTSYPSRTLLLDRRAWRGDLFRTIPAAVALAVVFHPLAVTVGTAIARLYPLSKDLQELGKLIQQSPSLWVSLALFAALPAVCEELAFRGFILSGFRHLGHKWRAIVYAAVFFGLTHGILQQSISACLMGIVVGFVAVQTGSLLPCVCFHLTHNAMMLATMRITSGLFKDWPLLDMIALRNAQGEFTSYDWPLVVVAAVLAMMLLTWFGRLRYEKTDEERLQDAIRRGLEAEDEPLGRPSY